MEKKWEDERQAKLARERDEAQFRKQPAAVPIRDQLDYSAYVNGFI